jgi:adenosylmethionine-8-amino-7-oxononanoate aminotransferase
MTEEPARVRTALLPRSFRKSYPVAAHAEGVYVWDADGRQYLDFCGGAAVSFIGHCDPAVRAAIADQAAALDFVHSSQFITREGEEFARELLEFAGAAYRGGAVYFTSGGSEAVETALKLARQCQIDRGQAGRFEIISRHQSYHGATLGAVAVSGNLRRRRAYLPMVREFEQVATPYCYRCKYGCRECGAAYAGEIEAAIRRCQGRVATFIFEPVSGATLGAVVPRPDYLPRVAEICRREGVLLVADEVMTGCGRTGRNFAVEHWDVAPDILVLGKGISSGYLPLGAVIARTEVIDSIARGSGTFMHGFTYNAHPVGVAAGRAAIARIRELGLVQAADSQREGSPAAILGAKLHALRSSPSIGDVRGLGLLWGLEFVRDRASKEPFAPELQVAARVAEAAMRRGLMVYPGQGCVDGERGDHILIAPPAITTAEQIGWAVERLRDAIGEVEAEVFR